jgi:DNA (cytosine-5)-methyltransferase 1
MGAQSMSRPKLLDLFCCEGGAAMGYQRAGFDVYGVDIVPQPRYPFEFHLGSALSVLERLLRDRGVTFGPARMPHGPYDEYVMLDQFAAIHASPPCQRKTRAQKIQGNEHPALIAPTRALLKETGLPYVIENVVPDGSDDDPLIDPIMLCGSQFGLDTYRHRLFETSFPMPTMLPPCDHRKPLAKMGRRPGSGEAMHVVGNFTDVDRAREVMEMPWASRDGLREAIPPAYTEFIGAQLLEAIEVAA